MKTVDGDCTETGDNALIIVPEVAEKDTPGFIFVWVVAWYGKSSSSEAERSESAVWNSDSDDEAVDWVETEDDGDGVVMKTCFSCGWERCMVRACLQVKGNYPKTKSKG